MYRMLDNFCFLHLCLPIFSKFCTVTLYIPWKRKQTDMNFWKIKHHLFWSFLTCIPNACHIVGPQQSFTKSFYSVSGCAPADQPGKNFERDVEVSSEGRKMLRRNTDSFLRELTKQNSLREVDIPWSHCHPPLTAKQ